MQNRKFHLEFSQLGFYECVRDRVRRKIEYGQVVGEGSRKPGLPRCAPERADAERVPRRKAHAIELFDEVRRSGAIRVGGEVT